MDNESNCVFPRFRKVGEVELSEGGMTKREYFAAMIMQGFALRSGGVDDTGRYYAKNAIVWADQLILEISKQHEPPLHKDA